MATTYYLVWDPKANFKRETSMLSPFHSNWHVCKHPGHPGLCALWWQGRRATLQSNRLRSGWPGLKATALLLSCCLFLDNLFNFSVSRFTLLSNERVGSDFLLRLLLNLKNLLFFHFQYIFKKCLPLTFACVLILRHAILLHYVAVIWDVAPSWWEKPTSEWVLSTCSVSP